MKIVLKHAVKTNPRRTRHVTRTNEVFRLFFTRARFLLLGRTGELGRVGFVLAAIHKPTCGALKSRRPRVGILANRQTQCRGKRRKTKIINGKSVRAWRHNESSD